MTQAAFEHLALAFRTLRDRWFSNHLLFRPPERQWEDDDETESRHKRNVLLRSQYDAQTDEIIRGMDWNVAPTSSNEMRQT